MMTDKPISLAGCVEKGWITSAQFGKISDAILDMKNILVVGPICSGKTTLANAILNTTAATATNDRIVVVEEVREMLSDASNVCFLDTGKSNSVKAMLTASLLLRPDRIIVGEIRGDEVLLLMTVWRTGFPGGCGTIHGRTARQGLGFLEHLLVEQYDPVVSRDLIAETINMVIFIDRNAAGFEIKEILSVNGYSDGAYVLESA